MDGFHETIVQRAAPQRVTEVRLVEAEQVAPPFSPAPRPHAAEEPSSSSYFVASVAGRRPAPLAIMREQTFQVPQQQQVTAPAISRVRLSDDLEWDASVTELLREWEGKSVGYHWVHERASRHYGRWNTGFLVAIILVNALSSFFVTISGDGSSGRERVAVGTVASVCGVLSIVLVSLQNKLSLSIKSDAHKQRAASHKRFATYMRTIVALPEAVRPPASAVLQNAIRDLDRMAATPVPIPAHLIQKYRESFRDAGLAPIDEALGPGLFRAHTADLRAGWFGAHYASPETQSRLTPETRTSDRGNNNNRADPDNRAAPGGCCFWSCCCRRPQQSSQRRVYYADPRPTPPSASSPAVATTFARKPPELAESSDRADGGSLPWNWQDE